MMPRADDMQVDANKSLACGATTCQADREHCCVATLRLLEVPLESDVSCQPRSSSAPTRAGAAGAAGAPACVLSLQCASDADCGAGSVCCVSGQLASCKAQAACDAELGHRLACKLPSECSEGQKCCLHMDSAVSPSAYTACEASCDLTNGGVRVCATDVDCQDDPASSACNPSPLLPTVRACWPSL
jgi:hypothetical protein